MYDTYIISFFIIKIIYKIIWFVHIPISQLWFPTHEFSPTLSAEQTVLPRPPCQGWWSYSCWSWYRSRVRNSPLHCRIWWNTLRTVHPVQCSPSAHRIAIVRSSFVLITLQIITKKFGCHHQLLRIFCFTSRFTWRFSAFIEVDLPNPDYRAGKSAQTIW